MTSEIVQKVNRPPTVESGRSAAGQWRTEGAVLSRSGATAGFDQTYREVVASSLARTPIATRQLPPPQVGASAKDKTQKAFEAAALQTFISTMMPNESGRFSAGSAGKMWKSVLAEKIAERIAASGNFRLLPSSGFNRSLEAKQAPPLPPGATRSVAAAAGPGPWQTKVATTPVTSGAVTVDAISTNKE